MHLVTHVAYVHKHSTHQSQWLGSSDAKLPGIPQSSHVHIVDGDLKTMERFGFKMSIIHLALDERLAVQKVLIQMSVDCGEALADARSSAKLEIDRLMAAGDAAGILRLKARARVVSGEQDSGLPSAKKARTAAGGIAERGSSNDAQPTIRWSKSLAHPEAESLAQSPCCRAPCVLDRACGLTMLCWRHDLFQAVIKCIESESRQHSQLENPSSEWSVWPKLCSSSRQTGAT